ncbi:MAG: DUF3500 domain-containing protein [Woeseiaceae bacterium]|nr:DUF3500 domain-containing protein [Woeseiaceae bacterium]
MRQPISKILLMISTLAWCHVPASQAAESLPEHAQSATRMTTAALAFIETLDEAERKATVLPLLGDKRTVWSNLPIIMVHPEGTLIGDMNDEQRLALHDLLRASMSSQGYAKASGIMRLDDLLYDIETRRLAADPERRDDPFRKAFVETRSSGNYAFAIFGDPNGGDWGWKLAGHHYAANFTVSDGRVAFTPMFVGSNPTVVESGPYAGWMAMPHEARRGFDFMLALTDAQQKTATIAETVADDVFEGPGRRASLAKFEGLKADELSVAQMRLLRALVDEYVRNVGNDAARAQLALIDESGWDELWFSWRGPVDLNGRFYFRVHGPRLLIEYNRQNETHDHSVMRDPRNDYGEDWLEHHYREYHPSLEEALETARQRARAAN